MQKKIGVLLIPPRNVHAQQCFSTGRSEKDKFEWQVLDDCAFLS